MILTIDPISLCIGIAAGGLRLENTGAGSFEFLRSVAAMSILSSYIVAYAIRIYIMNFYKNTRGKGQKLDNKAFFAQKEIKVTLGGCGG